MISGTGTGADTVRRCWQEIAGPGFERTGEMLVSRHAEPHRRYHTAEHVRWVLDHVTLLLAREPTLIDEEAVRVAALFHDAVYDPRSATNEADSAALAVEALTQLGWSDHRLEMVRGLVLATATHRPETPAAAVLVDADLAVLGAPPTVYESYVAGVRAEYSFVDDDAWRRGRAQVLESFLDRDRIYATPTMAAECEQQARRNLGEELQRLLSDGSR